MSFAMIKRIVRYFHVNDARGCIEGLVNQGTWREINLVKSNPGAVRGGHFHKNTEELFIVLEGSITVSLEAVHGEHNKDTIKHEISAGDVFIIPPYVQHTFTVRTSAVWLNALSIPMDKDKPDFFSMHDE